jgi:MAF protein
MKKIVLASASPRRKELLEQIGISFDIMVGTGEEKITKSEPKEIVKELALEKAKQVVEKVEDTEIIIGADTIVSIGQQILGKPRDEQEAANMLEQLQGNTHQVYTGVAILINKGNIWEEYMFAEQTEVTMYPMSAEEIAYYISTKEPMDKAGAYGIQGKSAIYIEKISGDYSNVVGLPIAKLYQAMKDIGISIVGKKGE